MKEIDLDYFFTYLFTDLFSNKEKLEVLSKLEKECELYIWIKKYYPKYYSDVKDKKQRVMSINLCKDLKLL